MYIFVQIPFILFTDQKPWQTSAEKMRAYRQRQRKKKLQRKSPQ